MSRYLLSVSVTLRFWKFPFNEVEISIHLRKFPVAQKHSPLCLELSFVRMHECEIYFESRTCKVTVKVATCMYCF